MNTLIATLLNTVDWQPIELPNFVPDPVLPHATHSGVLKAEEFELRCYKLSDGHISFDFIQIEGFLRGCFHCMTPGPCLVCHPPDDGRDTPRLVVVLGSSSGRDGEESGSRTGVEE